MPPHYSAFIELGKALAREKYLQWSIPLDERGAALDGVGWNLATIAGDVTARASHLRHFSRDAKVLSVVNAEREQLGLSRLSEQPLSIAWQELLKAAVAEQLLFKRTTTGYAYQAIARPLRLIATCVDKEPWDLTIDDLHLAIRVGQTIQSTGKLGDQVIGVVSTVLDAHHICKAGPLYKSIAVPRMKLKVAIKAKHTWSKDELLSNLEDRKRNERLPERQAFWELVRIVLTEKPRTFMDELRFAAVRALIATGMRITEVALLPTDWKRERAYLDSKGRPAGESGGISTSLMIRHFAEKQHSEDTDSRVLFEGTQPVPEMFRALLTETLDHVAKITEPLRKTLKLQCETGRLLPWYSIDDIVPFAEIYPRLTGNPFVLDIERQPFVERYRENFDPAVLIQLREHQRELPRAHRLDMAVYQLGNRLKSAMSAGEISLRFRYSDGTRINPDDRMMWPIVHVHVGELEDHVRRVTPTKVSDTTPLPLAVGTVQPWELLFLQPKRSLAEERNDGLCDVVQYMAIDRPDSTFIGIGLGDAKHLPSLFDKYGRTDEDRALKIESHALRHLQNTELFRLGVADTIISKRFNRRSVAQSYEYDHRSLAEELEQIDIPQDIEVMLGEKASTVARLIKGGKANGPIVDSFKRIQAVEGEMAAFEFLRAEADGFHATPYGHCLNSFTVDPCPKHLECFAGCRHLSATNLPENRTNLIRLEGKFKAAIETINSRTSSSVVLRYFLNQADD